MTSCLNITETGGIAITPLPQSERKPGFIMKPFFGVEPVLMDDNVSVKSVTKTDRCMISQGTSLYLHKLNSHKSCISLTEM